MRHSLSARARGALLGSTACLALLAPAAQAQTTPPEVNQVPVLPGSPVPVGGASTTTLPKGAVVTTTVGTNGGSVTIDINSQNQLINWNSYSVGSGSTVAYHNLTSGPGHNGAPTQGSYGVLNIVNSSGGLSQIYGQITSDPNIAIWISNPSGIVFGGSKGAFSGGGLVLTTGAVSAAARFDGTPPNSLSNDPRTTMLSVVDDPVNPKAVTILPNFDPVTNNPIPRLTVTGGVIIAGQMVNVSGVVNATGDVALIAADTATVPLDLGSPISVTITKGVTLGSATVGPGGQITGASILIGGAGQSSFGALLSVDTNAKLSATQTANGAVIISAGQSSGESISPRIVVSRAAMGGIAPDVNIAGMTSGNAGLYAGASGNVSVAGDASTFGDLTFDAGGALTLGRATTPGQRIDAGGKVSLIARNGSLTQVGTATVESGFGTPGGSITLVQGGVGSIGLGGTQFDAGGSSGQADASGTFTIGAVTGAISLGSVVAKSFAITPGNTAPATAPADFSANNIVTRESLRITSSTGSIRLGQATSLTGNIELTALSGDVTGTALTPSAFGYDPTATDTRYGRASLTAGTAGASIAVSATRLPGSTALAQLGSVTAGTGTAPNSTLNQIVVRAGEINIDAGASDGAIARDGNLALITPNNGRVRLSYGEAGQSVGFYTGNPAPNAYDGGISTGDAQIGTLKADNGSIYLHVPGTISGLITPPGAYTYTGDGLVIGRVTNAGVGVLIDGAGNVRIDNVGASGVITVGAGLSVTGLGGLVPDGANLLAPKGTIFQLAPFNPAVEVLGQVSTGFGVSLTAGRLSVGSVNSNGGLVSLTNTDAGNDAATDAASYADGANGLTVDLATGLLRQGYGSANLTTSSTTAPITVTANRANQNGVAQLGTVTAGSATPTPDGRFNQVVVRAAAIDANAAYAYNGNIALIASGAGTIRVGTGVAGYSLGYYTGGVVFDRTAFNPGVDTGGDAQIGSLTATSGDILLRISGKLTGLLSTANPYVANADGLVVGTVTSDTQGLVTLDGAGNVRVDSVTTADRPGAGGSAGQVGAIDVKAGGSVTGRGAANLTPAANLYADNGSILLPYPAGSAAPTAAVLDTVRAGYNVSLTAGRLSVNNVTGGKLPAVNGASPVTVFLHNTEVGNDAAVDAATYADRATTNTGLLTDATGALRTYGAVPKPYGYANLQTFSTTGAITVAAGTNAAIPKGAAQLGTVTAGDPTKPLTGQAVSVTAGAVTIQQVAANNGALTVTANLGDLLVGAAQLPNPALPAASAGDSATLIKLGATGEIRINSVLSTGGAVGSSPGGVQSGGATAGTAPTLKLNPSAADAGTAGHGGALVVSDTNIRAAQITSKGDAQVFARGLAPNTGDVTGLRLAPPTTSDGPLQTFGRISITAGTVRRQNAGGANDGGYGSATVTAAPVFAADGMTVMGYAGTAQLGTVTSGVLDGSLTPDYTARDQVVVKARAIDAAATIANNGNLSLLATGGQLTLGTGMAGFSATLVKTGASGELQFVRLVSGLIPDGQTPPTPLQGRGATAGTAPTVTDAGLAGRGGALVVSDTNVRGNTLTSAGDTQVLARGLGTSLGEVSGLALAAPVTADGRLLKTYDQLNIKAGSVTRANLADGVNTGGYGVATVTAGGRQVAADGTISYNGTAQLGTVIAGTAGTTLIDAKLNQLVVRAGLGIDVASPVGTSATAWNGNLSLATLTPGASTIRLGTGKAGYAVGYSTGVVSNPYDPGINTAGDAQIGTLTADNGDLLARVSGRLTGLLSPAVLYTPSADGLVVGTVGTALQNKVGTVTINGAGNVRVNSVNANGSLGITAANDAHLGSAGVGGDASVTATAGSARIGSIGAGGGITVTAGLSVTGSPAAANPGSPGANLTASKGSVLLPSPTGSGNGAVAVLGTVSAGKNVNLSAGRLSAISVDAGTSVPGGSVTLAATNAGTDAPASDAAAYADRTATSPGAGLLTDATGALRTGYDFANLTTTSTAAPIKVVAGQAAQLGTVAAGDASKPLTGQAVSVTANAITIQQVAANNGGLVLTANLGDLYLGATQLPNPALPAASAGDSATLIKLGATGEIRINSSLSAGGAAGSSPGGVQPGGATAGTATDPGHGGVLVNSTTNVRAAQITSKGDTQIVAGGDVSGLLLPSAVTANAPLLANYDRLNITAGSVTRANTGAPNTGGYGVATVTANGTAQLGIVSAGIANASAMPDYSALDQVVITANALDATSTSALNGNLLLTASVGQLRLETGVAAIHAALAKTGTIGEMSVGTLTVGPSSTPTPPASVYANLTSDTSVRVDAVTVNGRSTGSASINPVPAELSITARGLAASPGIPITGVTGRNGGRAVLKATSDNATITVNALSNGTAMLGAVTAGTGGPVVATTDPAQITVSAGTIDISGATAINGAIAFNASNDVNLGGVIKSPTLITITNTGANAEALGSGSVGTFSLTSPELNRLSAPNVVIDAGANALNVGSSQVNDAVGTTSLKLLTKGAVTIAGALTSAVTSSGTLVVGGSTSRILQIGGSADSNALASSITAQLTGGAKVLWSGTVDLRGDRIVFGDAILLGYSYKGSPLLSLFGATVADQLVASSASQLYRSTLSSGTFLQANELQVRYGPYALFQNSSSNAVTSAGVVLGQPSFSQNTLALDLYGPGDNRANTFALFGTINGYVGQTAAAVNTPYVIAGVGPTVYRVTQNNSRVNGCVIGAPDRGCLSVDLPTLTPRLFDERLLALFDDRANPDLTFDPLIASNNEALLGEAVDAPTQCPPGSEPPCPLSPSSVPTGPAAAKRSQ